MADAAACVALDKAWPKGYYRLGAALMAVAEWPQAVAALETGAALAPGNKDMVQRLNEARRWSEDERERTVVQVAGGAAHASPRLLNSGTIQGQGHTC